MPSLRVTNVLIGIVLGVASAVAAQTTPTPQPALEIHGRQGDYYWVVETAPDGSRRGGWVSVQVPLGRIDRSTLQPIPALPAAPTSPVQGLPEAASLDERLARIERALAAGPSAGSNATPQPATSVQSAPAREVEQPRPQAFTPTQRHPHTREGFWFNGGMGLGLAGCQGCVGRDSGLSGGVSLGGTISDKVLFGVGTSGWYKSYEDGSTLSGGTTDARVRFYPSLTSGFFITGGLGIGQIRVGLGNFGSVSETGVGALFGVGWDIRISPNVSLTPFYNGFAVQTSNADGHVDQFGLGITVH